MNLFGKTYIFFVAAGLALTACTADEPSGSLPGGPSPLAIKASISSPAKSRAVVSEIEDEWSYVDFTPGDKMGFYSAGGNWNEDGGRGDFTNQELIFEGNQFVDAGGAQFSPTHMESSKIYMYFPYSADIATTGYELRVSNEGIYKCRDFLSSNKLEIMGKDSNGDKVSLFGDFLHGFSELIIMRGEGFDNPPQGKEQIFAVLSDPITDIRVDVTPSPSWSAEPKLFYNPSNKLGIDMDDAQRWEAWQGGNYGKTQEDPEGTPAWYVIVPTIGCTEGLNKRPGERSVVEYIELYDNDGYLQRVTSLQLSGGNTKNVDAGWRYPMEIVMKELVPTVNPFAIVPWNEDVELTDERKRGINNLNEFERWVAAYNAYILAPDDAALNKDLLQFGDQYVNPEGESFWHFYVLNDIDLTNYTPLPSDGVSPTDGVIIPVLKDILDGISTNLVDGKFENYKITGLTKTFIGNLEGTNGILQNFDFISPDLRFPSDSSAPQGVIATNITGGSVVNCNIDDATLYNPGGPSGIVTGTMDGGLIKDCTLGGMIYGSETGTGDADRLTGTKPTGEYSFINNDISGVIFN